MNAQQRKTLHKLTRAAIFVETDLPALADASPGFAAQALALKSAIAKIDQAAPDRGSGNPAKTASQRALLHRALRTGQLYPIRRAARVLARTVTGMQHLVNRSDRLSSRQTLLDAAKATVRDIEPYKEQFIASGLSTDFLDQVTAMIQALEEAERANIQARQAAKGAQGALIQALQEGRDALTLLDSAIRQRCNMNPALGASVLSVWNTIVVPRGRASRTASDIAIGTAADVMGVGKNA